MKKKTKQNKTKQKTNLLHLNHAKSVQIKLFNFLDGQKTDQVKETVFLGVHNGWKFKLEI